ncbi:MAG: helix-turn-helix domain-containing protein [Nitrospira sp.]|nr:helix-turn-helix domain-containing protein [Nitrospira sp.]
MQTLLTVKEVCGWLNVKQSTLYLWVSQNRIPYRRLNGLIRFETPAIQAWLDRPPRHNQSVSFGRHPQFQTVDAIIEAAKREVYTPRHGETRPKSGLIVKEEQDGAHEA